MKRADGNAPWEPVQRRLGAKRQVVHDDGACGGYREQRAVVRERQCVDGFRAGMCGQRLYNLCLRGCRRGVFNDVYVAPHGQDERPLVFDGEATNVILRNVAAVGQRPQGFDECAGGIVAGERICRGDIEGAAVWGPKTRYV